jgi:hypothetical protein
MSFTVKNKYLFLAILIALAGIFALGWYSGHKRANNASEALILALQDSVSSYQYRLGDLTKTAFEQAQIITTQKEALKNGDLERKELRALNLKLVNEINELNLQVDTLLENVSHNGTIIVIQQETIDSLNKASNASKVSHNAILLPFTFDKSDKWLSLKGTFNSEGKLDIGLKLIADVDVFTGIDKKTKQYKSVVTSDCPYIDILNIKSQKFDLKKPTRFGIGAQIGYGVTKDGLSPYAGFGISWNAIRF